MGGLRRDALLDGHPCTPAAPPSLAPRRTAIRGTSKVVIVIRTGKGKGEDEGASED